MSRCDKCKEVALSAVLTVSEKQSKYLNCFCEQLLAFAKQRNNVILLNFATAIGFTANNLPNNCILFEDYFNTIDCLTRRIVESIILETFSISFFAKHPNCIFSVDIPISYSAVFKTL